jgi:hypothetical protein
MNNLLFDLIASQSNIDSIFHGGVVSRPKIRTG